MVVSTVPISEPRASLSLSSPNTDDLILYT